MKYFTSIFLALVFLSGSALAEDKAAAKAWKKSMAEAKTVLKINNWLLARDVIKPANEAARKFDSDDSRLLETLKLQLNISIQLQDYTNADPLAREVLEINARKNGTNSLGYAFALCDVATVDKFTTNYFEAETFLLRAESIEKWKFGAYDPMVGLCVGDLASVYYLADRFEEAEKTYHRAIALAESPRTKVNFSINHYASESRSVLRPDYIGHLHGDLGLVYHQLKKFEESEKEFIVALDGLEHVYGKNSSALIGTLDNSGYNYLAEKKFVEAEGAVRRALKIAEDKVKSGHSITASTRRELIRILRAEGKEGEAKELLASHPGVH